MCEAREQGGVGRPVEAAQGEPVIPAQAREEIESALSAFRQWLLDAEQWRDQVARQPLSADLGAAGVDFHTVVKEWIALKEEVRLESRGGKANRERLDRAADAFQEGIGQVHDQVRKVLDPLVSERDRMRDEFQAESESQQRHWVELLLDVRDALARGAESSRQAVRRRSWRRWFLRRDLLDDLLEGYDLALRRIDAALQSRGIVPIQCEGLRVDPQRMRVVDVVQRDDLTEGAVVEVVRPGYVDGSRVIRFAEVRAVGRSD
jgi:molecular chaperone GrpE (heat shock protein)